MQTFNYNAKQSRRWLRARLLSENRGFISKDAASQLVKHFLKTEHQLQHLRIADAVLTADAKGVLFQLDLERGAARSEQGYPERVQDWWQTPTVPGRKKGKGMKNGATKPRVTVEGLGDEVGALELGKAEEEMEEDREGALLEQEYEGFEGFMSPVMLSPTGSVVDSGEEDEEEDEEE